MSSTNLSRSQVLTLTGATVVTGLLAYAIYFDYKRRSDPVFRKKLRSEKKRVQKTADAEKAQNGSAGAHADIIRAAHARAQAEELPDTPERREQYFSIQIATAEKYLTQGSSLYLEAAVCFYQALRVYPAQMELVMIYQRTLPQEVIQMVMDMYNIDVLASIHGYYDNFPPRSMNILVQSFEQGVDDQGNKIKRQGLVAAKDFKAGEEIYSERPILAVLDGDIQGRGTHCSRCLRTVQTGMAIKPESDPLNSVYCSKQCQLEDKITSQNMLFTTEPPLPKELDAGEHTAEGTADRVKAQQAFVEYLKGAGKGKSVPLMIARFLAMQITIETSKLVAPERLSLPDLPYDPMNAKYNYRDHMERLRYLELTECPADYSVLRRLLETTVPGLESSHDEERHMISTGKFAYNAIGVCYGGGRDDKPQPESPLQSELTRTPYGTSRQIGSGLYLVSAYLSHSCTPSVRPSFSGGTSELHLIATKDIARGEELQMAYVDVSQHEGEDVTQARQRRRKELARGWRIACECAKCQAEMTPSQEASATGVDAEAVSEATSEPEIRTSQVKFEPAVQHIFRDE